MIRRPPRATQSRSSAASDVYKRQVHARAGPDRVEGAVVSPRVRRDLIGSIRVSGNDRIVTVICTEPGEYHTKRGRSVLATYVRHAAGDRPAYWHEARR